MGVSDSYPALRRCTAVPVERFGVEVWSRAPSLSTATELGGGYDDLFSLADADELLSRRGLRTPFLRIARNGEVLPAAAYTGGGGVGAGITDQVRDDRVLALFAEGSTLVLQGLHRTWGPLAEFSTALSGELGHPVQVNAYLTPPQSQGFSAHYDVHDVFVLQLAGTKRWVIHPPVLSEPLRGQPWTDRRSAVAAAAVGPPALSVLLAPGDALYLPRGWLHAATAQGEVSAHLTVGIHNLTRYALAEALLAEAAADPELRRSLPLGLDPADPDQLAAELAAVVHRLQERLPHIPLTAAAQRIRGQLWSGVRPAPLAPLAQAAVAAHLTARTGLVLRPGLRHEVRDVDGAVEVRQDGATTRFELGVGSAVRTALGGAPFVVGELPAADVEQALDLGRRLLVAGLVVPAPSTD